MKFNNINKKSKFYSLIGVKAVAFFGCFFFFILSATAQQQTMGSIWDGVEVNCDNILQVFTEYDDTISTAQQAFIDSLRDMEEFLQKNPEEIKSLREETRNQTSGTVTLAQNQKLTVGDMGVEIMDALEECIQ